MDKPNSGEINTPHLIRSLTAVIIGSFLLRAAAGAMGENIQFYFNAIHDAAINPFHPLRGIAGAENVYEISYTVGGLIIGTFFAAELIGAPIFGAWSDRYGRKLFIIFGPLFGAIAVQITAMTTLIWALVFTRLLEGLSTASNAPATLSYMAEATAGSQPLRSRVIGLFEVATVGGIALGLTLGGWLWRNFGRAEIIGGITLTSPAFAFNALIYLASLAVLWFGLHEVREAKSSRKRIPTVRESWQRYGKLLTNSKVRTFAPAWIAINAVLGVFLNLAARLLTDRNKFPGQLLVGSFDSLGAGNITALYAAFFVVGILFWTVFFPNVRRVTVMLIGIVGLFLTCVFLFLINHQPSMRAPFVYPLGLALVLSIMIQSGFTPAALGHLADITEEHTSDRGAIMGFYSIFLGIGQFIGSVLGGPFVDWNGADGLILVITLLGVFAAAFLIPLYLKESRQAAMGKLLRRRRTSRTAKEAN